MTLLRAGAWLGLWLCLAPLNSAHAAVSTSAVHVSVFRRTHFSLSLPIVDAFERLLRGGGTSYRMIRVENIASHFNGEQYSYRIPARLRLEEPMMFEDEDKGLAPSTLQVMTLEAEGGTFALVPPAPDFFEAFERATQNPDNYPSHRVTETRRGTAEVTRTPLPGGAEIQTLKFPDFRGVAQWRDTIAVVYKIRIGDNEHEAVFLYKTRGGEGRLAAALQRLREKIPGLLVLNRGEIFVSGQTKTTGTVAGFRFERMGVDAAVPGSGEMARLSDLLAYREASPTGVQFVAANLVYSTETQKTLLPPYTIFERAGKRIAVLGLVHPGRRSFLDVDHAVRVTVTDPLVAAEHWVPKLRKQADIVIALTNLSAGRNTQLKRRGYGLDLIAGDYMGTQSAHRARTTTAEDDVRGVYSDALLTTSDSPTVLSHVELRHRELPGRRYGLSARERHVPLDETLPDLEGFPKFQTAGYGVTLDTRPAILPSTRRLYPLGEGLERLHARDFWSMAASLAARRTGAEAGVLPRFSINRHVAGDVQEDMVRDWFRWDDRLAVFELSGASLRQLLAEVRRQEKPGQSPPAGGYRIAAGGLGAGDRIHGVPIDSGARYRVAGTQRLLADAAGIPGLGSATQVKILGSLRDSVIAELRRGVRVGWDDKKYRELLLGRPVIETALWRVNFRDINLNVSNTKVVGDEAFAAVPNARVQAFDELLIGAGSKIDVEYLRGLYKWTNTLEAEYSKSKLSPPGRAVILNTPKNRLWFRTLGTLRLGSFPYGWIGKSFGPSFGLEYEGHLERLPLTRRRHIVSVLPGVELYDGSVLRSVQLAGNIRRDFTPLVPRNNYGTRLRALLSRKLKGTTLQGELLSNYFVRTPQDTNQDLRLEMNAILKLHVPIYKDFSVAPFIDFYYFMLKVRPVTGYSSIMGLSLSFSRLWKPQYEGL
jgi:hypothetical protein